MRQTARISRIALAVLLLGSIPPAHVSGQEGGPLLKSDLVRMMTASNYTSAEMAAIVRMNCVGFKPTARDRNQLGTLPGSELVMAEVERCVSRPAQAAGSNRVGTQAAPVAKQVVRTPPRPSGEIAFADLNVEAKKPNAHELQAPRSATALGSPELPSVASRETRARLTNWNEITTAFLYEYRPNVRSSGTVLLSLRVGMDGSVLEANVKQSTGDQAMADAALRVTRLMKFKPATIRDEAVESLTEIPIEFTAN